MLVPRIGKNPAAARLSNTSADSRRQSWGSHLNKFLSRWLKRVVVLVALTGAATAWAGPSEVYWHDQAARALAADAPHPAEFRALTLDTMGVAAYLKDAHQRGLRRLHGD